MQLSIVILNYKKGELAIKCVSSIVQQFNKQLQRDELEVIVVDNNSPDNSASVIEAEIKKNKYRNIFLFRASENLGFGGGCNLGASKARGKYLLFLNNDTVVKDREILNMVGFLEQHQRIAILGGALHNLDGSEQVSSGKFYTPLNAMLLLLGLQKFGVVDRSPKVISEVDWVKGALLMIRKEVFEKLGGFDTNIFMYTEDMEFCYRAKKAGYKVYFYPDINVVHEEQGSSNRTFAVVNIYKNLLYFYKKHKSVPEYIFLKSILELKARACVYYGKITHNSYLISTYEQALKNLR